MGNENMSKEEASIKLILKISSGRCLKGEERLELENQLQDMFW